MQNDRIIRCLAHKGKVNVRCINSKNIVLKGSFKITVAPIPAKINIDI